MEQQEIQQIFSIGTDSRQAQMAIFNRRWRTARPQILLGDQIVTNVQDSTARMYRASNRTAAITILVGEFDSQNREEGQIIAAFVIEGQRIALYEVQRGLIHEGIIQLTAFAPNRPTRSLTNPQLIVGFPRDATFAVTITDHTNELQSDTDIWRWRIGQPHSLPSMWLEVDRRLSHVRDRIHDARTHADHQARIQQVRQRIEHDRQHPSIATQTDNDPETMVELEPQLSDPIAPVQQIDGNFESVTDFQIPVGFVPLFSESEDSVSMEFEETKFDPLDWQHGCIDTDQQSESGNTSAPDQEGEEQPSTSTGTNRCRICRPKVTEQEERDSE